MHRLIGMAALAACYAPRIQTGIPCAAGDVCPGDLQCSPATHTCEESLVDASVADASRIDAPGDGPQTFCYGNGPVHVCLQRAPSGNLVVSSDTAINTSDASKCTEVVDGYCVIAQQQLTIISGVVLTATGTRPLVLIATGAATIDGVITASSRRGIARGAGANPSACLPAAGTSSGGGAGGSFAGRGGNGGAGASGAGGASAAAMTPSTLRGGCDGATAGQPGGAGGGAVALISAAITVGGTISAAGAGGTGGVGIDNGGGGGGAGGMIVLDAPTVTTKISAAIFANGGGGGKGGANGGNGQSGADATTAGAPAAGGTSGNTNGGNGGPGSIGLILSGAPGGNSSGAAGGGGGGGGAGVIKLVPLQFVGGLFSPPPT